GSRRGRPKHDREALCWRYAGVGRSSCAPTRLEPILGLPDLSLHGECDAHRAQLLLERDRPGAARGEAVRKGLELFEMALLGRAAWALTSDTSAPVRKSKTS